ncbi:protein ENHANCED DISEASE RESISTANCE 2-like [Senna tora]|uniref:Protein ENHANCED DISEASE RESISTANCE 2-like n=1 Tax=Senna tora TaxID=362788 RepID=A0A834X7P7_9FABA|nr:protein ENHANCED DISEASE RESISTANCE 2-like [Senna tora]
MCLFGARKGSLLSANCLKEYIGANPAVQKKHGNNVVISKLSYASISTAEYEEGDVHDEFYDAIAADTSSSDEEIDDNEDIDQKEARLKLKNTNAAADLNNQLDTDVTPIQIDPSNFHGSLNLGKDEKDTNCWSVPSGNGFMIRGKNYLKDNSKEVGGDPLLKLIAVDWFKVDSSFDKIALHSRSLVQSDSGKNLPFVLIMNLQVPAKPNYSLVLYYAADRPVKKDSLLGKFIDGNDTFRDTRFKLIPSIVQGYWMVKRAVGTKACLLGKAVTCRYFRQDNFLEIDVDIGSSSVARSVIGLVLGYVTSLVVDLAILIEAKEEEELPEYILGTVRLNRLRLDSAEHLKSEMLIPKEV